MVETKKSEKSDGLKDALGIFTKKPLSGLMAIFIIVLIVFFTVKTKNDFSGYNRTIPAPNISVAGEGKVIIKPDVATVSIGVVKSAKNVGEAQGAATLVINNILAFLKTNGIAERDIKTTNYTINPQYDYRRDSFQPKIISYEVRQSLQVKIRDLTRSGEVLSVGTLGANDIGSLSFTVDDIEKIKEEARSLAIKDAMDKAQNLSKNLGVRFGKVIAFYESSGGGYPVYFGEAKVMTMSAQAPTPQVPIGENEIKAQVTLTYEIK